nr:hypothetical protein [uncultured Fibrobacter sp.]
MKLPRRKREFTLFLFVLSFISMNIIAPLITCFEVNFSLQTWAHIFQVMPMLWPAVGATVLITYKPADFLTRKFTAHDDSFRAKVTMNILCTVFLMSIILTVVGSWIGAQQISMEPISRFFYKWPRNFAISLFVEIFIAQPIARQVMFVLHKRLDSRKAVLASAP